jgi:hypothetical protein
VGRPQQPVARDADGEGGPPMNEQEDEIIPVIAGMPFGAPNWTAQDGFKLFLCPVCKNTMWLGPKQIEKVKNNEAAVACMKCIIILSDKETLDNMKMHHLSEGGEPTPLKDLFNK